MTVELTARNVDLTPRLETRVTSALKKLMRVLDDAAAAHVILSAEKHRYRTEIVLTWRDRQFTGTAETTDLTSSVRQALARLERQTLKQKEKFTTRRRVNKKTAKTIRTEPVPGEPQIIKTPRYEVKPLTPDEAAQLLQTSEEGFLVFRDAESQRVAVIYKRADGNFGLIEP